jgi:hypothetical protein
VQHAKGGAKAQANSKYFDFLVEVSFGPAIMFIPKASIEAGT